MRYTVKCVKAKITAIFIQCVTTNMKHLPYLKNWLLILLGILYRMSFCNVTSCGGLIFKLCYIKVVDVCRPTLFLLDVLNRIFCWFHFGALQSDKRFSGKVLLNIIQNLFTGFVDNVRSH